MSEAESGISVYEQMMRFEKAHDDPESDLAVGPNGRHVRKDYFAPGQEAEHDEGFLFRGPWETLADGFCEHTRRLARSIAMAGAPVHLRSSNPKHRRAVGEDRTIDEQYGDLLQASIKTYVAQVRMVVPTHGMLARFVTHRHYSVEQMEQINARQVFSTVWERLSGLAHDDVAAMNRVGQCWVASRAAKAFVAREGVDEARLRWVPCPFMPDDPHLALSGRERKPGPVRFYHIGKWEPRKEQRNIMLAFLRAFQPGDAMLLLKTSERAPDFEDYPSRPMTALKTCLEDGAVQKQGWTEGNVERGVFVIARRLSFQQMIELHRMGDVYVTLSRGEGFDMPAFDSKLSGNLMVYTPSGGPQDFSGERDALVPRTGLVDCHPFYRWPQGSKYIDYDVDWAVAAMQRAAEAIGSGLRARGMDIYPFSAEAVGQRCRGYLEELAGKKL